MDQPIISIFGCLIGDVLSLAACLTSSGKLPKRNKNDLFGLGLDAILTKNETGIIFEKLGLIS